MSIIDVSMRLETNLLMIRWTKIFGMVLLTALAAASAEAGSIAITCNLAGTGTVVGSTPTTLMLNAQATDSVLSSDPALNAAWNPISYSDQSVLELTTNLLNGSFTMGFADGDTLVGTVFEDDTAVNNSPSQTGPFPQTLTFIGGTGAFAGASGSVSGTGYLGAINFTVTGNGNLNTSAVPEPTSAPFLLAGLVSLGVSYRLKRQKV